LIRARKRNNNALVELLLQNGAFEVNPPSPSKRRFDDEDTDEELAILTVKRLCNDSYSSPPDSPTTPAYSPVNTPPYYDYPSLFEIATVIQSQKTELTKLAQ
jgi:hypothetical protein